MTADSTTERQYVIPGFEFIERVGQGGMAEVWKARQISLDRIVAVKVLQAQLARSAEDIKRLLAEARAAAKLKHQGIVQVYDAGEANGLYYIVMEFIAGYNVGEWLRRKKMLDEHDALLVAECVASALNYSWTTAGIIHCDIKPDNVMVDRDGTIKVADLGLSRIINPRIARPAVEEIIGTPSYISPEQSKGEVELDCRTDIYALGATLYHMVTGKRLFEQYPDLEAMDRQISDVEPDPIEFNPALSPGICWMIEKMLVKDRDGRQSGWDQVLEDIHAVQEGRMPVTSRPAVGASTVKRSPHRPVAPLVVKVKRRIVAATAPVTLPPPQRSTGGRWVFVALAVVLLLVMAVYSVRNLKNKSSPGQTAPEQVGVQPQPTNGTLVVADNFRESYEYVARWEKEHPGAYQESIQRYRKVARETTGTKYSHMAEDDIRRLESEFQARIKTILDDVRQAADKLARDGHFAEAAAIVEQYNGPMATETAERRRELASEYRQRSSVLAEQQRQATLAREARFKVFLDQFAVQVVAGQLGAAQELVAKAQLDQEMADYALRFSEIRTIIDGACAVNERIVESFRPQIGRELPIQLNQGVLMLTVTGIEDRQIKCRQNLPAGGSVGFIFQVEDLATQEKLLRMGADTQPEVALGKGVMAIQAKAYAKAAEYFTKTGPLLSGPLSATTLNLDAKQAEERAEAAAVAMLQTAGLKVGPFDEAAWREIISSARIADGKRAELRRQIKLFQDRYGSTRFAARAAPLLEMLGRNSPSPPPGAEQPVIEQDDGDNGEHEPPLKVRHMLLKKNIGLHDDEIGFHPDARGMIFKVTIFSPAITDLSPLIGMGISDLAVGGQPVDSEDTGKPLASLRNLGPLSQMPELRRLAVSFAVVEDLSPMRTLKLQSLKLRKLNVRDNILIQDMPLEELVVNGIETRSLPTIRAKQLQSLDISGTLITDFLPLSGQPLRQLIANDVPAASLACLKGMALEVLHLNGSKAYDFSSLRGMPLRSLELSDTQFKDYSILKTMPLTRLVLCNLKSVDLVSIAGLRLDELNLSGVALKDIEPLRDMRLKRLRLGNTKIRSIAALREMPLETLDISRNPVSDLAPLKDMKLVALEIYETDVRDLSPLQGMPLRYISLDGDKIRDLNVLRDSPIEVIWIRGSEKVIQKHRWALKMLPQLRYINGKVPDWK